MAYETTRSVTMTPLSATVLAANRFVRPGGTVATAGTPVYPAAAAAAGYVTLDASPAGSVAGISCAILDGAILEVAAGAAVAAGASIATDATGRAITAAGAAIVLGVALEAAAAAGEVLTFASGRA